MFQTENLDIAGLISFTFNIFGDQLNRCYCCPEISSNLSMSLEGCVSNIGDELNVMQKKYNILCGSRAFKYLADICTNNRLTNKPVVWNLLKNANWPLQFLKFCRTIGSKNSTDYRNQIEFGRKTKQKFKIGTSSAVL